MFTPQESGGSRVTPISCNKIWLYLGSLLIVDLLAMAPPPGSMFPFPTHPRAAYCGASRNSSAAGNSNFIYLSQRKFEVSESEVRVTGIYVEINDKLVFY